MYDRVICISCIQNHLNYIDLAMKIHNEMVKLALVELLGYNYTNLLTNRKNYDFFSLSINRATHNAMRYI